MTKKTIYSGAMKRPSLFLLLTVGAASVFSMVPALTAVSAKTADAGPARGLADNQLSPLSLAQLATADQLMANGDLSAATDHYEAALAADPRNRNAFLGLARIAEAQGLLGKAIRFYREALALNPNDEATIELQGMAYVERGAIKMAEANLERLQTLCGQSCASAERLQAALTKKQDKNISDEKADAAKADQKELPDDE